MCTAYADDESISKAIEIGVSGFLVKPIEQKISESCYRGKLGRKDKDCRNYKNRQLKRTEKLKKTKL